MKKSSRRFNSEKTAMRFSKSVSGEVRDLRSYDDSKSNFKVVYYQYKNGRRGEYFNHGETDVGNEAYDFDSDINTNGMHWHTAEDL